MPAARSPIIRWYISMGSQADSASTVRPEGSMTVPVRSCLGFAAGAVRPSDG